MTWSSKKQAAVALSSCESENIALAYAGQEAVCLSDLLSESTFPRFSPAQTYEDNMGALQLSGTTVFSSRAKHICTRYHFLRELVALNKNNRISCQYNRSAGRHFHQNVGLPEVQGHPGQDNQFHFLRYFARDHLQHLHHHLY